MDPAQTMIDNLPEKTGRSLEQWLVVVKASELPKHGAIVKMLKSDHGVTHGFANLIAHKALAAGAPETVDLLTAQYAKKPAVRPLYDAVVAGLTDLEFEIIEKKTAVALKRSKQFAYLQPSTKTRLDVGIQLKGEPGTERLLARSGAMTSHNVRVTAIDQIDRQLFEWLRLAWERC